MTVDLREVIADALQRHSSPTVGVGDIHGGQHGWIVYEGSLVFVAATIAEAVDPVLKAQRDEIRAEFSRPGGNRMTPSSLTATAGQGDSTPVDSNAGRVGLPDHSDIPILSGWSLRWLDDQREWHFFDNYGQQIVGYCQLRKTAETFANAMKAGAVDYQRTMAAAFAPSSPATAATMEDVERLVDDALFTAWDELPSPKTSTRTKKSRTDLLTAVRSIIARAETAEAALRERVPADLVALSKKATPGPWVSSGFGMQILTGDSWNTICVFHDGKDHRSATWEHGPQREADETNAFFVAAAVNYVRTLTSTEPHHG